MDKKPYTYSTFTQKHVVSCCICLIGWGIVFSIIDLGNREGLGFGCIVMGILGLVIFIAVGGDVRNDP